MIVVRPEDSLHKAQLLRVLTEILDSPLLSQSLYFKGGTCASLLGLLDRFSIDLDFDLKPKINESKIREKFHLLFRKMNLEIKNESKNTLEFFLKYQSPPRKRNTLKIDALPLAAKSNIYAPFYLAEIDRTAICQTKETLVANKLVTPLDRYKKHRNIAGRDIYDIHHFLINGYSYNQAVIKERTDLSLADFFKTLENFVQKHLTQTIIDEDLNTLLPFENFKRIRKILKQETLMLINQQINLPEPE